MINDIDMKLGSVTKLDKKNKNLKKLAFFRFLDNLKHSGSRIGDDLSTKLTFSLKITFYLIKTEN